MGIETAIIAGALIGGGMSAGTAAMNKATKMPTMPNAKSGEPEAAMSRDRTRKKAMGAYGRSDTILTGPLGDVGQVSGQRKTLLGQ
jgi:hypothetical protein